MIVYVGYVDDMDYKSEPMIAFASSNDAEAWCNDGMYRYFEILDVRDTYEKENNND
jgi:hypothetical protein